MDLQRQPFYNISSGILRAMGDSQTPLRAMVIASVTNIILDLLFVMGFHWGVEGAAIATVTAQVCSGAICTAQLGKYGVWKIEKRRLEMGLGASKETAGTGTSGCFSERDHWFWRNCHSVCDQWFWIPLCGRFHSYNKLYGLFELAAVSFGYATSSFVGQNLGAEEYGRIKEGVRASAVIL